MIARLFGVLEDKTPQQLIVNVGGVGYQVFASLQTFYRLPQCGEPVHLQVHTHVREDALVLYGFLDDREKACFLLLKGVAGIGPRLALNILSGIPVDELELAIGNGDVRRLVAVPGVGKKTAERLVVELREKVSGRDEPAVVGGGLLGPIAVEALSALMNLGYRRGEAEKAVQSAAQHGHATTSDVIRDALRSVSA